MISEEAKSEDFLYVQCVRQGPKLRMRIVNGTGYNKTLNCQGPREIRVEGRVFKLSNPLVVAVQRGSQKPFYRLPDDPAAYEIVMDGNQACITSADLKNNGFCVYEQEECVICMCESPTVLFKGCCHMCACSGCWEQMQKSAQSRCPMCRQVVRDVIVVRED